jgi:hypothetical protein
MPVFDWRGPHWVTPDFAQGRIQTAWLCQVAGASYLSKLIMHGTQGVHSHSAFFAHNEHQEIDVLELTSWYGGRIKPLAYHLAQPGRYDVFSPCRDGIYKGVFDPEKAHVMMHRLTQYEYGWPGLIQMALCRIPVLWRLYPPLTTDMPNGGAKQPFCSHAVCTAYMAGGVDPVPRCPNWLVSPAMLTTSLFFEYEFSIVTPWAERHYSANIRELATSNERLAHTVAELRARIATGHTQS